VLVHFGYPRRRDAVYFGQYRSGIRELAAAPNVSCEFSDLRMTDRSEIVDSLR